MTDFDEHELTVLFERDAASVEPRRVPLSAIVGRSRRARHRRRSVAAATGVVATVGLGALALRVSPEPSTPAEVRAASPAETPDPTDGSPVDAPPLRMGLAIDGATVTSAIDAEETFAVPPAGTQMRWSNQGGDRNLFVLISFRPKPTGQEIDALPLLPEGEAIDLGNGVQGRLTDYSAIRIPGTEMPHYEIRVDRDDLGYTVIGTGLTKDEVIAVTRSLSVDDDGDLVELDNIPTDLGEGEEYEMPPPQGARTFVNYAFADGSTAAVEVHAYPEQMVLDDIERVKAHPTAEEFLIEVRGHDAIVRGGDMTTNSVSWQEDTGELVVVLLTQAAGPAVPDLSVVVDGITVLDEPAFQDLVARFPG